MQENPGVLAVSWAGAGSQERARELARRLGLPVLALEALQEHPVALVVTPERLELRQPGPGAPGAVFADLTLAADVSVAQLRSSTLARALGLHRRAGQIVADATAGLGRDLGRLLRLGCRVDAIERSPIMVALLEDAVRRGRLDARVATTLREHLRLHAGDSRVLLPGLSVDAVLLDPMFPPRPRVSAKVRKEMRLCRLVAGSDPDAAELLELARRHVPRVVVKRPVGAPPLAPDTTATFKGRTTRYDMYLTPRPS